MLTASLKEEAFIRLSKSAGCTVIMPGMQGNLQKESQVTGCTVLLSLHYKKRRTGCLVLLPAFLKDRTLRMLSGFTGCTVLVPVFFKENAVKETGVEKAIVKQAPEAFEATEVTVVPEATEVTEVTEVTEATEVTEVPEATEVTEVPEATEVTEVPEATEVTEVPEATMVPEATEAIVVTGAPEPPQHPIKEATIIPLTTRTVRYPRFLNRHRTTIHAIN